MISSPVSAIIFSRVWSRTLIPNSVNLSKILPSITRFSSTRTTSATAPAPASTPFNQTKMQEEDRLMENIITLNLVRHGETEMNKADIVQSRTPGDLTDRGVKMAEKLGKFFRHEKFHRVYTSDLRRCHDTTLNILKHNHDPPEVILKPILRERDYGDLELKPNQTVRDLMIKHGLPNHAVPIPGAESHQEVMKRCAEFFDEICQLADEVNEPQNILAVSHGSWILCFLDHISNNSHTFELKDYVHQPPNMRPILNTGRTKIHIGKAKSSSNNNNIKRPVRFVDVHCIKHIDCLLNEKELQVLARSRLLNSVTE